MYIYICMHIHSYIFENKTNMKMLTIQEKNIWKFFNALLATFKFAIISV